MQKSVHLQIHFDKKGESWKFGFASLCVSFIIRFKTFLQIKKTKITELLFKSSGMFNE